MIQISFIRIPQALIIRNKKIKKPTNKKLAPVCFSNLHSTFKANVCFLFRCKGPDPPPAERITENKPHVTGVNRVA